MKLPELPHLRELNRDDEQECNLVLSGWLRTYVDQSHGVERSVFYRLYEPLVRELIARSQVLVACMPDEPDVVYAWAAWEGDVLHYCVTKPKWQKLGIMTWMLRDFFARPARYSHRTAAGMRLALPSTWIYSPMARFQQEKAA